MVLFADLRCVVSEVQAHGAEEQVAGREGLGRPLHGRQPRSHLRRLGGGVQQGPEKRRVLWRSSEALGGAGEGREQGA